MIINLTPSISRFSYFLLLICISISTKAQTIEQEKMEQLSFMVGDWLGTSTSYKNDTIAKQVAAFEQIAFKVGKSVMTIDLNSESLQLHTVIYYDAKEETYFYTPYYKQGSKKYRGEYKDGKFMVWFNPNKRLIFSSTSEGHFQEYGETLEEGVWHKYFEDILNKMN